MIAHDDRILHWALRKLLRDEEDEDLAASVHAAWERGERGSWTEADELPGEHPQAARPPARRGWPRWAPLFAAASVVLLGGAAFLVLRDPAGPGQPVQPGRPGQSGDTVADATTPPPVPAAFALAARPVERLAPGASGPVRSFEAGERVLVGADEATPIEIRLAGGGRVLAEPGTLLELDQAGEQRTLHLELGGVSVRRGEGSPLAVDAGFARLSPDRWAAFRVRVEPDDAAWSGAAAPSALTALARGEAVPRVLLVTMDAGGAELRTAGADEGWTLRENDATHVLSDPRSAASLARADTEWLAGLCRRAAPISEREKALWGVQGTNLAEDDALEAGRELRAYLDGRPEAWALLQPVLFELLREERGEYFRGSVLDAIVADSSPGALRAARALWRELPEGFGEDHIVTLAARGAFEFQREARARVEAWSFGDEPVPIRSAAWMASSGDERGRGLLEDVAAAVITDRDSMLDVFVASLALEELGDPAPWVSTRTAVAREARAALERGDEAVARAMAVALDFVERRRSAGERVPIAFLGQQIDAEGRERADELATPEAVLALLERLGA